MPAKRHALWSGSVSFGLVAVPVAAIPAVHSTRTAFHMIHEPDKSRLKRRMFCPEEEVFVHPEHILRGYEIEPDKHIIIRDSEIESIAPKRSKTVEIREFVDRAAISPAYYDRPYYLVPTGAEKPYRLLVDTLAEADKAGLSEFVMHAREHFCAVMSIDGALCLMTLRYPEQLRSADDLKPDASAKKTAVTKMKKLIEQKAVEFKPDKLTDVYQERIDKLIARKKKKKETVEVYDEEAEEETVSAEEEGEDIDLVAALEESLAKERKK
ncbi:MAG: Ku protein [Phycisphaerae bacterium]